MLSPFHQQKLNPENKLLNSILETLIQIQITAQTVQRKYESNVKYLSFLNQEIESLNEGNKQLSEIELILSQCCQVIERDEGKVLQLLRQVEKDNTNKCKQVKEENQGEKHKKQSIVDVMIPNLGNLEQYFKEILQEDLLDKYLERKMMEKAQEMKHHQQIAKLQQKLQTVDQNLNNALTTIKNQRKQF